MIKPILDDLKPLVADELKRANLTHPHFHSPHEGWAVILEEVEEAKKEMDDIELWVEGLKYDVFSDSYQAANKLVKDIRDKAVRLAAEAIQIAAMCDKWKPYGEVQE